MTFNDYFSSTYKRTLGQINSKLRNEQDAQEASLCAYYKMFRGVGSFRRESGFDSWFYTIVENVTMDFLRKRNRTARKIAGTVDADHVELYSADLDAEEAMIEKERKRLLYDSLSRMEITYSVPLQMWLDGMTCKEITDLTWMPAGTLKSRLHRGKKELIELAKKRSEALAL